MAYTPINWKDSPEQETPLTAANLNHMDDGIADCDERIAALEAQLDALFTVEGNNLRINI